MLPGIYQIFVAVAPFLFPSFYFNSLWASYVCSMWYMPKYDRQFRWVHICACFLFSLVSLDSGPYPFVYMFISNHFPPFILSPFFWRLFLSPIHSPEPVAARVLIDLEAKMRTWNTSKIFVDKWKMIVNIWFFLWSFRSFISFISHAYSKYILHTCFSFIFSLGFLTI